MSDASDIAPPPGADFHYASFYFAPRTRTKLHLIEALRRELLEIPENCSDRGVAHIKLAWWREELDTAADAAPRHHLTRALRSLSPTLVPAFRDLAEHVAGGLGAAPPADDEALDSVLDTLHGPPVRALIDETGGAPEVELPALLRLARLVERANALAALRRHRDGGWLYLSRATLESHGLTPDQVRHAARSNELGSLVNAQVAHLLGSLEDALGKLPRQARRRQRLVTTLARIAQRRLALTLADGCAVLERRVDPTPVAKLAVAWRTRWLG